MKQRIKLTVTLLLALVFTAFVGVGASQALESRGTDLCTLFLSQDPEDINEPYSGECRGTCDNAEDCDVDTFIGTSSISYQCYCGDDIALPVCPAIYTYEEPTSHTITCIANPLNCISPAQCTPQHPPWTPSFSPPTLACSCQ